MKMIPIAALLVALLGATAAAQEGEVALIGWVGRAGSLSAPGATTVVTVRWDVTEGELPADLHTFTLERDGVTLATMPAGEPMAGPAITALYAAPENDRRRREMLRWLDALDPDTAVTAATIGDAVAAQLATDSFWAHYAARIDPVIAQARHLAYVDTTASGKVVYVLRGTFLSGKTVDLGRVAVDTTVPSVLPPAAGLAQLQPWELARCDAPDRFRVHGTVALDWEPPGTTPIERLALDLSIAGWDLYRSTVNVSSVAPRDLRAEAALLPHGPDGLVPLSGLEKVNDQPILVTANLPATEPGASGWSPAVPAWQEARAALRDAGVEPGDERAYYLVPRDITGNWGATEGVLVTVPDLLPPPAPWEVRAVPRPAIKGGAGALPERMVLRWPDIGVLSYAQDHPLRTWCNLDEARLVGRLEWADDGVCPPDGDGAVLAVQLDVADYLIYRFDAAADAQAFEDSDGDGHADAAERTSIADPGFACNAAVKGGTSALVATVPASVARTLGSGARLMEWMDTTPAAAKGTVYWYRVAARASNGALSPLSAPVRALYPDAKRKSRLHFGEPSQIACTPYVSFAEADTPFVAQDLTKQATVVRLRCQGADGPVFHTMPLVPDAFGNPTSAPWPQQDCTDSGNGPYGTFADQCREKTVKVDYLTAPLSQGGTILATGTTEWAWSQWTGVAACGDLHTRLLLSCPDVEPLPGRVGDVSVTPPAFDPEEGCIGVYRAIGGRLQRVELICDEVAIPEPYEVPTLGGEQVCLYTAVHDRNALVSPKLALGCATQAEVDPQAPQPLGLSFDPTGTTAVARYVPPEQRLVGAIVEWSRDSGADRGSAFVAQPATLGTLGEVEATVDLGAPPPPTGQTEQWCFRVRSVVSKATSGSLIETLSGWSPERCSVRKGPAAKAPVYLPWPSVPTPPDSKSLTALFLPADGVAIVHLTSYDPVDEGCSLQAVPTCFADQGQSGPVFGECLSDVSVVGAGCEMGCDAVEAEVRRALGFVAYRQQRAKPGAPVTDWVQISPLVDQVHCTDQVPGWTGPAISDPWIGMLYFAGLPEPWDGREVFFVDRYPYRTGVQVRYQLVYFDVNGEIVRTATSPFVTTE